jgi:dUTPase
MIANAVAIFDADFRGEYIMQFYNYTSEPVEVPAYTRLEQLEFFPYLWGESQFGTVEIPKIEMQVNPDLYQRFAEVFPSERGAGGIGSTG